MESARLAHQAVVAFAGAGVINRTEPRACGTADTTNRRDCKGIAREGYQTPGHGQTRGEWDEFEQTREGKARFLRKPSSNRTGENPPYGMSGGDWGNTGSDAACAPVPLDSSNPASSAGPAEGRQSAMNFSRQKAQKAQSEEAEWRIGKAGEMSGE